MMKNKLGLISLLWITKTFAVGEEGRLMKDPLCPTSAIQYTGGTLLSGTMVRDVDGERVEDFLTDLSMKIAPNAVAKKRIKSVTLNDFVSKIEAVSQSVGSMTASALKRALKQIPDPQHLKAQVAQQNRRLDEGSASLLSGVTGVGSKLKAIPTPENRLVDQLKECLEEIDGVESGSLESKLNALHALLGMAEDQSAEEKIQKGISSLGGTRGNLNDQIYFYTVSSLAQLINPSDSDLMTAITNYLGELGNTGRTLSEQTQYVAQKLCDPQATSIQDAIIRLKEKVNYAPLSWQLQSKLQLLLEERYDNNDATLTSTGAETFDGRIQALITSTIDSAYTAGSRTATLRGKLQEQLNLIAPGASSLKAALTTIANSVGVSYSSLSSYNHLTGSIDILAKQLGGGAATCLTEGANDAYGLAAALINSSPANMPIEILLNNEIRRLGPGDSLDSSIKSLAKFSNSGSQSYKLASLSGCTTIQASSNTLNASLNSLATAAIPLPASEDLVAYTNFQLLALKTLFGVAAAGAGGTANINSVVRWKPRTTSMVPVTDGQADTINGQPDYATLLNDILVLGGYN
jgi:hypothetical protein